ncbi:MAG TPA: hypothetical protein VNO30_28705 [Kofleriaceae bacterium]|nr:hypothetical protein [Kofleriaceae bacterium]
MRISISKLARRCAPVLALVLGQTACSGDTPDMVDRFCTKALYESCITEHDCATQDCRPFATEGYMICTQGCDATTPCPPLLNGMPVPCTNNVCTPAEPTECTVMP